MVTALLEQAMVNHIKLVPVEVPHMKEMLAPGVRKRPCIEWSGKSGPLILGRNHTTKVADSLISRKLAEILVAEDTGVVQLVMKKSPNDHQMQLSGKAITVPSGMAVEVHNKDRISLYDGRYEYVCVVQPEHPTDNGNGNDNTDHAAETMTDTTTSLNPTRVTANEASQETMRSPSQPQQKGNNTYGVAAAVPAAQQTHDAATATAAVTTTTTVPILITQRELTEEAICAVCMDIMVDSTSIVPCGHVFCRSCLKALRDCPTCRKKKSSQVPAKHMDNMIWHMIRSNLFETDDVEYFLNRSNKTLNAEESKRIIGRVLPVKRGKRARSLPYSASANVIRNSNAAIPGPLIVQSIDLMSSSQLHENGNFNGINLSIPRSRVGASIDDAICID